MSGRAQVHVLIVAQKCRAACTLLHGGPAFGGRTTLTFVRSSCLPQLDVRYPRQDYTQPVNRPLPAPYRVLIADDAPTVREALRWVLENEPDFTVVGEASDGVEALDRALALRPDVVILDIEMPRMGGATVTRMIKACPSPPIVIVLTVHGELDIRRQAAEAGSDGFVEKSHGWLELIKKIRYALVTYAPRRLYGPES